MLNFMRRHAKSTTIKILFWIIIAVFVLWGVGTFTGDDTLYAASVNGETITPKEVRHTARQLERFYQQLYGQNLTPEILEALDLENRALDQMISGTLMKQEAVRLGFGVTDEEVRASIESIEGLNVDGRFQREVYFRYLRAQGVTTAEFESQQRDRLLVQKVQELIASSIRADEVGARELFVFQNEKVDLAFLRVKAAELAKEIHPSEAETAKFYEDHREMFREPDRVAIDYVAYDAKDFATSVGVTDADIAQEYETFKSERYSVPEEVHVRHVLFALPEGADAKARDEGRNRAKAVLERLRKGEDFAAVARELSDDKATSEKGGDLGFIARGRAEETFENAAFALQPGELSDVVETRYGLHVVKVEERRAAREKPLAEVRDEIAGALRTERAGSAARDAAFVDAEKAGGGKSLQELAQTRALSVESPPAFAQGEEIVGLTREPELVKAAFATAPGQVGPVVSAGDSMILFRVRETHPAHVPALKEIRAEVENALRDEQAKAKARERAEALRQALAGKKPIEEVAATEKLTVEETGPFTRAGEYVPRIGTAPDLKKAAFALTREQPVGAQVYVVSDDAYVIVLKDRLAADVAEFEKKKTEIVRRNLDERRQAAIEAMLRQLKARARIRVNAAALASI
ncbi:MAG: SurA N-terminal domain-containing protein [Deltaproteobacteria bacterium]|nr:SurA N-terminal domain-containing protein [Deltaproteobacteria bacterium]